VEGSDSRSRLRGRLVSGPPLVGTVVTVPDVVLAELTASAFDIVWIDLEHGALASSDVAPLAIAARSAGAAGLVRLSHPEDHALGAVLDAGVDGVVAPNVETAEQAERLVDALRRPPRGSRGLAARRESAYGRVAGEPADPVCFVQIESPRGVANAAEIASVEGADALVAGCGDLALSLGEHSLDSSAMRTAVASVQEAAAEAGVASGVAGPGDPGLLARLSGGRSRVHVLAADLRLYAAALHDGADRLRGELARGAPRREEAHVCT
jgi:4-hydroxy-2-oxoheptanedioate aldolase